MKVIGHRGAAGLAPENTLGLFIRTCEVKNTDIMKNAICAGVDGMTFDFPDLLLKELGRRV